MIRTIRIPKRIGPVKVPKKIRKEAKRAMKAAASPLVRDLATAAMAAADRIRREAGRAADEAGEARSEPYRLHHEACVEIEGSKVLEALRTAAIDGLRRFLEGFEEGLRNAQAGEQAEAPPKPRAKPKAKAKAKAKPGAEAAPKPAAAPKAKRPARKPSAASPASPGAAGSA